MMSIEGEMADSGPAASLKWDQWKKHTPLLYDMLINNNLTHPSPCVHWGHRISEDVNVSTQRIYYSERGASPNAIVVANAKLRKERATEPTKIDKFDEHLTSENIDVKFKIRTPEGAEVNKIYTCEQNHNILVTKSDLSDLHVWDLSTGGCSNEYSNHRPSAVLQGHATGVCESNFSLDTSPAKCRPRVLSGDREGLILMWQMEVGKTQQATLGTLGEFRGHEATVEDVCFHPHSDSEFCSVGDDKRLLFWDERQGLEPTHGMPQWSSCDLHCLDWNDSDVNLLVTGAADGATFVFDRRKLSRAQSFTPLHSLHQHKDAVLRVGWLPGSTKHFASGGDDAAIYVWDLSRVGNMQTDAEVECGPPEIIFKHCGHRGSVQDLHWNPSDSNRWVMASVSEDGEWAKTNTMQIWRPLDLLYRDDGTCLKELSKMQNDFRSAID